MIETRYEGRVRKVKVRVSICDECGSEKEVYRFVGMWCDKKRKYRGSNMPIRHTVHTDRCKSCLEKLVGVLK